MFDLTRIEIQDTETVIIPVGSIEQHGDHLPVGTDYYIATAFAERLSKILGVFQIPCFPVSTCREHMGLKGSVWMDPDIFYGMMISICDSLKEQGFRKVIIIQGHGGIFAMTPALRQLNAVSDHNFAVCRVDLFSFMETFIEQKIIESSNNLHAGELETSLMMFLHPDMVVKENIVDFVPDISRDYLNYGSLLCASPSGVWGNPSYATKEKGERLLDVGTDLMIEYANDVFAYMKNKKTIGYSNF